MLLIMCNLEIKFSKEKAMYNLEINFMKTSLLMFWANLSYTFECMNSRINPEVAEIICFS